MFNIYKECFTLLIKDSSVFSNRVLGISETVLEDPAKREEIYAFVEENDVLAEMRGLQVK